MSKLQGQYAVSSAFEFFSDHGGRSCQRLPPCPPTVGNVTQGQCVPGTWKKEEAAGQWLLEEYHDNEDHGEDNRRGANHQAEKAIVIHLRPHCFIRQAHQAQTAGPKPPHILMLVLLWSARA